jgi:ribosome-binding protein aMBF1 (putative translation factor)
MKDNTCAVCDCELDETRIAVKIGGRTVEVCCEECAQLLREAETATRSAAPTQGSIGLRRSR